MPTFSRFIAPSKLNALIAGIVLGISCVVLDLLFTHFAIADFYKSTILLFELSIAFVLYIAGLQIFKAEFYGGGASEELKRCGKIFLRMICFFIGGILTLLLLLFLRPNLFSKI